MRTPRPDGMSEGGYRRLERLCESGYRRVGVTETRHGHVFVAVRDKVENGVVDPFRVKALWACRDFAQENEIVRCSNLQTMKLSVDAVEKFFGQKDF